jgi:hypothetical protein
MHDQTQFPMLIHTRRGAIVALIIGILFNLRNLRYLVELYVPGHTSWLTRYRFAPTPFSILSDLCFAMVSTGAFIYIFRRTQGNERVYLLVWVGVVAASPLKDIHWPASANAYEWLAAIAELALIPSALRMCRDLPALAIRDDGQVPHS